MFKTKATYSSIPTATSECRALSATHDAPCVGIHSAQYLLCRRMWVRKIQKKNTGSEGGVCVCVSVTVEETRNAFCPNFWACYICICAQYVYNISICIYLPFQAQKQAQQSHQQTPPPMNAAPHNTPSPVKRWEKNNKKKWITSK